MTKPLVGILIGSASDLNVAAKATDVFREFGVEVEVGIASAHRTPADVVSYAASAEGRGIKVIIAMAGLSAALPGVVAAHTTLPVVGVPIASGPLAGSDALLSVTQMPPGIPVGSMGIDGAKNAALMALRIIALGDDEVRKNLQSWSEKSAAEVRKSRSKVLDMNMQPVPAQVFQPLDPR